MAGDRTSVYAMVHQVLADSKRKLEEGQTKVASPTQSSAASHKVSGRQSGFSKIADACDRLAECIHLVNDDRTPREKLAEYAAIHQALTKKAFEVGNDAPKEPSLSGYQGEGNKGEHQDQEAEDSSQPPVAVPLDDGSPNPGGPDSALLATPAMTPGESLDAGESGEATDAHLPPDEVTPNESPQPLDAANALETNQDMMMPEQAEDVLKQSSAMRKLALARKLQIVKQAAEMAFSGEGLSGHPLSSHGGAPGEVAQARAAAIQEAAQGAGMKRKALDFLSRHKVPLGVAGGALGAAGLGYGAYRALGGGQQKADSSKKKAAGIVDPEEGRAGMLETGLGRAYTHGTVGSLGGAALGGLAGAALGRFKGVGKELAEQLTAQGVLRNPITATKLMGAAGAAGGAMLGAPIGGLQGFVSGAGHAADLNAEISRLKNKSAAAQEFSPAVARKLQIMSKMAEDALNPAQIEAGTEPELQSAMGIPNQLSQGSEAGEMTPRETAPNVGEGSGRELLSSLEAAINATKADAKGQNKGPLSEVLTEPSMSEAHDSTLDESLDNAGSAGVKISSAQVSAARELLRRYINAAPGNAMKVAAILKMSADGADPADVAPGGGGAPMPTGGEMASAPTDAEVAPMEEEGIGEVSEEALAAAAQGVTPEEVEQAQQLLAMQELAGEEGQQEAPAAGAENMEITSQMGGMGMSSQPTPSPWSGGAM